MGLSGLFPQGTYLNDVAVMDLTTRVWAVPPVAGAPPSARADTGWCRGDGAMLIPQINILRVEFSYDAKASRLLLFGGRLRRRWPGCV